MMVLPDLRGQLAQPVPLVQRLPLRVRLDPPDLRALQAQHLPWPGLPAQRVLPEPPQRLQDPQVLRAPPELHQL